jgi:hypothetical protein
MAQIKTCTLPEFQSRNISLWLSQVEFIFEHMQIDTEVEKFNILVPALPYEFAEKLKEYILKRPENEPYTTITEALKRETTDDVETRLKELLEENQKGDMKPTKYLQKIRTTAEGTGATEKFIKGLFWKGLDPATKRELLVSQEEDVTKMAQLADKLHECSKKQNQYINNDHLAHSLNMLREEVSKLKRREISEANTGKNDPNIEVESVGAAAMVPKQNFKSNQTSGKPINAQEQAYNRPQLQPNPFGNNQRMGNPIRPYQNAAQGWQQRPQWRQWGQQPPRWTNGNGWKSQPPRQNGPPPRFQGNQSWQTPQQQGYFQPSQNQSYYQPPQQQNYNQPAQKQLALPAPNQPMVQICKYHIKFGEAATNCEQGCTHPANKNNSNAGWCYYHKRFGAESWRCEEGCSYSGN